MLIGVLALQGDFAEHAAVLRQLGIAVREVRLPQDLEGLDGLILPGGESTTVGKLAVAYGVFDALKECASKLPLFGTCGGLVFMATGVGYEQPTLGFMDITVQRNAFGRQVDSFECDLNVSGLDGGPFHAVFIRAPAIEKCGPEVEVLAKLPDGRIVAARQGRCLVTSFHPELTDDLRVHRLFAAMC